MKLYKVENYVEYGGLDYYCYFYKSHTGDVMIHVQSVAYGEDYRNWATSEEKFASIEAFNAFMKSVFADKAGSYKLELITPDQEEK